MPEQPPPSEEKLPDVRGGLEFGKDATNAYSGEVGYDNNMEYTTEIADEESDDEGISQPSHPSTLQRIMVRKINYKAFSFFLCACPPKKRPSSKYC